MLGRVGLPDDIGPVIASLLSENNRWINAHGSKYSVAGHLIEMRDRCADATLHHSAAQRWLVPRDQPSSCQLYLPLRLAQESE
ncbi:hypothetical protein [Billgrantia endophytica]|uniref:hypothetical protein n=1 Tax=Billgrantia endophytica TaxID=2033802 RepID=UPI00197B02DE|nr:hypothetical protein [Halomonas endophytica]